MAATAGSANQFGSARSSQRRRPPCFPKDPHFEVDSSNSASETVGLSGVGCPKLMSDRYFRGHNVFVVSLLHSPLSSQARFSPGGLHKGSRIEQIVKKGISERWRGGATPAASSQGSAKPA